MCRLSISDKRVATTINASSYTQHVLSVVTEWILAFFRLLKVHYRVSNYRHFFSLFRNISSMSSAQAHTDRRLIMNANLFTFHTMHCGDMTPVDRRDVLSHHIRHIHVAFQPFKVSLRREWVKSCEIFNFQLQLLRRAKLFNISHLTSQSSAIATTNKYHSNGSSIRHNCIAYDYISRRAIYTRLSQREKKGRFNHDDL